MTVPAVIVYALPDPLECRTCECCGPTTSFSVSATLRLFCLPCVSYQCGNEPEQFLLFRAISLSEECPDLDLGNMSSRGRIGVVFDKDAPGIAITCEIPTVSIGAVVKLSDAQHGSSFRCDCRGGLS